MKKVNRQGFKQRLLNYKKRPLSFIVLLLTCGSAVLTAGIIIFLVGYIFIKGIPHIKSSLFYWEYSSENVSMLPAIINTVTITILSVAIAAPVGIFSAVYLTEYSAKGRKYVKIIRTATETLAGIPSVVFGLFGYLIFVIALRLGYSILSGALTLAIMTLPTIMRTTEEALKGVPKSYREGGYGLGAGKLRTVFRIVLPSAFSGIISGIILSVGRIVGETAALIYTAGTVTGVSSSVMRSGRTLSVHLYALLNEGLYTNEAYATSVVLMLFVLVINSVSFVLVKRFGGKG